MDELEQAIKSTANLEFQKRLSAVRLLLLGYPQKAVAEILMKSQPTLRRWVSTYNEFGIDGLDPKPHTGRPRKISSELREVLLYNLDHPELSNESHWTLLKLYGKLRKTFLHDVGYSTFTDMVRSANYRRLVPRPESPDRNEELRTSFVERLQRSLLSGLRVWFMDEAGFLADPRPKAMYAKKGTKPVCPATGRHVRQSVIGATQADTGDFVALLFQRVDTPVFQAFLDEFDAHTKGEPTIMVLDNASWHKAAALNWHNIQPLYLPPYSPDLNPIERLWKYIKEHWFAGWYTKTHDKLQARLTEALCSLFKDQDRIKSVPDCVADSGTYVYKKQYFDSMMSHPHAFFVANEGGNHVEPQLHPVPKGDRYHRVPATFRHGRALQTNTSQHAVA